MVAMPAAKSKSDPNLSYNGHALQLVKDGEEWDADNELWCILRKAVCQNCGKAGGKARSTKGALQKFQREHPLTRCEAPAPATRRRKK
jgi:hypothetical protein